MAEAGDFLIIGHRGTIGVDGVGENTVASVRRALEDGADAIEFDVYAVPDAMGANQLIVIHDDDLDRTTDGSGPVMGQSFEDLRRLDAGKGEKIPTVDEVLGAIAEFRAKRNAPILVNIELKGPRTAQPAVDLIKRYLDGGWQLSDFIVSSFDHQQLRQFHELLPDAATAVLVDTDQWSEMGERPDSAIALAQSLGSLAINPGLAFLSPELVRTIHDNGLNVFVWTGNTDDAVRQIRDAGADGVFANNPASARRAIGL